MSNNCRLLWILLKQEIKELLYSKFLWFITLFYVVFFLLFVFVGMRESNIFGFTGMSRVLFSLAHTLVFLLPLLALASSAIVITQYRENGTMEFFFSQPVSRRIFFLSLTITRLLILLAPLTGLILIASLIGIVNQSINLGFQLKFFLVSCSLLWCFLSVGLYISESTHRQTKAIVLMLLAWILSITFMDFALIGLILKFDLSSEWIFFLSIINPIQVARLSLLSELDPELSNLGFVGFFIANKIGNNIMFLLGIVWPVLLGSFFWLVANNRFKKNNIV